MNTGSRVFKTKTNQITQIYKKGVHNGIDLVGYKSALDYEVAHSDGVVVGMRNDYNKTDSTGTSYGNYVKIKHDNGYYTLYAHIKYNTVTVKVGERVKQGQVIGYMGNTGHSFGAHLHFEVHDTKDVKIDPTPYINADLPGATPSPAPTPTPEPTDWPKTYTVAKGDTLSGIAKKFYGSTAAKYYNYIAKANNIADVNKIITGQVLTIPEYKDEPVKSEWPKTHKIVRGDTLSGIAKKYYGNGDKAHYDFIAKANKITNANLIIIGRYLTIPEYK